MKSIGSFFAGILMIGIVGIIPGIEGERGFLFADNAEMRSEVGGEIENGITGTEEESVSVGKEGDNEESESIPTGSDPIFENGIFWLIRPNLLLDSLPLAEMAATQEWKTKVEGPFEEAWGNVIAKLGEEGAALNRRIREKIGVSEDASSLSALFAFGHHFDLIVFYVDSPSDGGFEGEGESDAPESSQIQDSGEMRIPENPELVRVLSLYVADRRMISDPDFHSFLEKRVNRVPSTVGNGEELFSSGTSYFGEVDASGTGRYVLVIGTDREQVVHVLDPERLGKILSPYLIDSGRRILHRVRLNEGMVRLLEKETQGATDGEGDKNDDSRKNPEFLTRFHSYLKNTRWMEFLARFDREGDLRVSLQWGVVSPELAKDYKNILVGLTTLLKVESLSTKKGKKDGEKDAFLRMLHSMTFACEGERVVCRMTVPKFFFKEKILSAYEKAIGSRGDETGEGTEEKVEINGSETEGNGTGHDGK